METVESDVIRKSNILGRSTHIDDDSNTPPFRIYYHKSSFPKAFKDADKAMNHVTRIDFSNIAEPADYLIFFTWGSGNTKMVDLFRYSDTKKWPGNPDIDKYVFKNGIYSPYDRTMCGDSLIILGAEESHRRDMSSLKEYMENPPAISGLFK